MKTQITALLLSILLVACSEEKKEPVIEQVIVPATKQIVHEEMQIVMDPANLNDVILICDL